MKVNMINKIGATAIVALSLTACSDSFLSDKQNYDNATQEIYNYESGCQGRVDDIYAWCLPNCSSESNWKYNCTGLADDQSKSTEEYTGFSVFVNPVATLTYASGDNAVPDYFNNQANNVQASVWGRIRNINDAIAGVQGGTLSQDKKNVFLGQLYFFRAWCYYNLVKWYGGVPIVDKVLETDASSATPRATTKACIEFMSADLDKAIELLDGKIPGQNNYEWGRVSSAAAAALQARVWLLWASPIFNRADLKERWKLAYEYSQRALALADKCGYKLVNEDNPGTNGSGWAAVFSDNTSKEGIFVSLYNTIATGGTPDFSHNNGWENGIRPSNTLGGGGKNPSSMIVDLFPMADGRIPNPADPTKDPYNSILDISSYTYDNSFPFMNRDPRFYRTFAFPGVRWAFSGDPSNGGKNNNQSYNSGKDYVLWNYVWYTAEADRDNFAKSGYAGDNLLNNYKGMYVRKRTDDYDVNSSPLYSYTASNAFKFSAAPWMEIRYAEVVLNCAEAAAGYYTGQSVDSVKTLLKRIHKRAGLVAGTDGEYGLSGITASRAKSLAAVLYERQVELAYEGKRFDDMRRWLLFDGGIKFNTIKGAPTSWSLSGEIGGGTCAYLGFEPLNGQRRDNIEFRLDKIVENGTKYNDDPLITPYYNTVVRRYMLQQAGKTQKQIEDSLGVNTLWTEASDSAYAHRPTINLSSETPLTTQASALKLWYSQNVTLKPHKGDAYKSGDVEPYYIKYDPKYYFLGLYQGAMYANPTIKQTIGWGDYNAGGSNGTFDPLAE